VKNWICVQPDMLGMSALLTKTMPYVKVVIDTLREKGVRNDYIVLVGGARSICAGGCGRCLLPGCLGGGGDCKGLHDQAPGLAASCNRGGQVFGLRRRSNRKRSDRYLIPPGVIRAIWGNQ